nr:hypothetical protein [Tanacetum cinerariifolium]
WRWIVVWSRCGGVTVAVGCGVGNGEMSGGGGVVGGGGSGVKWRVRASHIVDRIDRVIRVLFGFVGKSQPEKFSGGGRPATGVCWPAAEIMEKKGYEKRECFEKQYLQNKVQQMRGARGRAYAIDGGIWYSVVSSKMNQLHSFSCV